MQDMTWKLSALAVAAWVVRPGTVQPKRDH
jgi:hypothetical protein